MIIFLNGQFVQEDHAHLSVRDRGFLYGDGLFETMLVWDGKPFRWSQHWARLSCGAALLQLSLPYSSAELEAATAHLATANQLGRALLRLSVSRGVGPRGYSPRDAGPATVLLWLHPWLPGEGGALLSWRLHTCSLRLQAGDPLGTIKSSCKLLQVLARLEAESHQADEALLLNSAGGVAEAASANVFWVSADRVFTPALAAGGLEGITRGVVLELCRGLGWATQEIMAGPESLTAADGVFLTMSSHGVVEVSELDQAPLRRTPLVGALSRAYWDLVRRECKQ